MSSALDHPVFRYSRHVLCFLCAGATVIVSGMANPQSVPWLLALYLSLAVVLAAARRIRQSALIRWFVFYMISLFGYLAVVWVLYVCVPGPAPDEALKQIYFHERYLMLSCICMAQIHYSFTLRFAQFTHPLWKALDVAGWIASLYYTALHFAGHFITQYMWVGILWVPAPEPTYMQFFWVTTVYLTLGVLVPFIAIFQAQTRTRRLQMLFYFLGSAPSYLTCWTHFLITLGVNIVPLGGWMFLLHAALTAYAVLVYRTLPITLKIRRGLAYAICCVILGAIYAATSLVLAEATPQTSISLAVRLCLLLLFIFVYAPLLGWLQHRLDSFFFRDSVDREQLLERFAQETGAVLDLAKVAQSLCGVLDLGLKPRRVELYLKPSNQDEFALFGAHENAFKAEAWPSELKLHSEVAERIAREAPAFRTKTAPAANDRVVQLATGDESLAVPIVHGQERLGCILIGPKTADEEFTAEDVRFAETLAANSSNVLQNARSFLQIERLQKLTASILNALSTGVLLVTDDGAILSANTAACAICGTGERFPMQLSALWDVQPILASAIRQAIKERDLRSNDELRLEGPRGTRVLFSINDLNVADPHGMYVAMLHDITDYKQMQALAEQRENMARIGEAAATINHEIKNLLQPIRYQVDRLTRVDAANPAALQKEVGRATAVIPDRLSALERMLRNLNHLGRPLTLRPVPIDLEAMVRAIWSEITANDFETKPAFVLKLAPNADTFVADANWMRQVLYNVLANAAEATVGRTQREVCVSADVDAGVYALRIQDNGRGITPEEQAKLFTPFFSTKGQAGTGLGLCLCRKIIEAHGGRIDLASAAGPTTVEMTLPQRVGASEVSRL